MTARSHHRKTQPARAISLAVAPAQGLAITQTSNHATLDEVKQAAVDFLTDWPAEAWGSAVSLEKRQIRVVGNGVPPKKDAPMATEIYILTARRRHSPLEE